ncbi:MAG: alpha/beta fold hydrolase [Candidatus Saccharibacteria bacterium]|nr:alpha/beta fold hydrolase [Candidatus Saccharibacteria bacterium]
MLKLTKTYDNCVSKKPRLTVVCVHGIADDSSRFIKPLEYLEGTTSLKDIRFVRFDLLGSGKSTKSDKLNYDFKEQLEALYNAINALKLKTPLVLMGHSMGCLISARFAEAHKKLVKELILISPPVFRPEEFDSPKMAAGKEGFKQLMILKDPKYRKDKAFNNELEKIVFNKHNYAVYTRLTKPTTIIYGATDQIIASYNIPGLLKSNPKITAIKTPGSHGIGRDKYGKLVPVLERILNETV